MQITEVAISVIANPHSEMVTAGVKGSKASHDVVFLQIKTDEGLEGHAFAWGGRSGQATAHLIASIIRPLLIGQDPLNRELQPGRAKAGATGSKGKGLPQIASATGNAMATALIC